MRDLLGFKPKVIDDEYNKSDYPFDKLPLVNIFLETGIARGMLLKGKWSGITHIFKMDVNPRYKIKRNLETVCSG